MRKANRLGKCEVCASEDAKYTCPSCEVKTCSLSCATIHKKELNCTGVRNKVAFKRISNFTNFDFQSDYMMLEEIIRSREKYSRDQLKHCTREKEKPLPMHLHKLKTAAFSRKTYLSFLPQNFSKHKLNTTLYNFKEEKIYWRVEWIFPQANNIKCVDERLCENDKLASCLNKYLNPVICDTSLRDYLQFYQSAGLGSCMLLLRAEHIYRSGHMIVAESSPPPECETELFYELDPSLSLKHNFSGKYMLEYPTIYVIIKNHRFMYTVYDSDEEAALEEKFKLEYQEEKQRYLERRRRNPVGNDEVSKVKKKIPNNFLFNSSDSSSDEAETNTNKRTKRGD